MSSLDKGLTLRGRFFTPEELASIRDIVAEHYVRGRTFISERICEKLKWYQPNGWFKDRACRDVLLRLEELGQLQLPPRRSNPQGNTTRCSQERVFSIPKLSTQELDLSSVTLDCTKLSPEREGVWNSLVSNHHYLGYSVAVGRTMKYLVTSGAQILGAVGFSDSSWAVKSRDDLFRAGGFEPKLARTRVANNNRFVILPWVRVPNLASKVLGLAAKSVAQDWEAYYGVRLLGLETFVEMKRFSGTCYRASNWRRLGSTAGYAKQGTIHVNSQSTKDFYFFPLARKFFRVLEEMGDERLNAE